MQNNTIIALLSLSLISLAAPQAQAASADKAGMMGGHQSEMRGEQCRTGMKAKLDTDKDGKVSKDEFNRHHEEMFGKMDKNGDGFLEDSEMHHPMDMKMQGNKHRHDGAKM